MADDLSIGPLPDFTLSGVPAGGFVPDVGSDESETPEVGAIPTGGEAATTFKDTVKQLLSDVNDQLQTSDQVTQDYATGRTNDIQKVVTTVEEANLALQYTMAVRQKLLDAYQEISRITV